MIHDFWHSCGLSIAQHFWVLNFFIFYQKVRINIPEGTILDVVTLWHLAMLSWGPSASEKEKILVVNKLKLKLKQFLNYASPFIICFNFFFGRGGVLPSSEIWSEEDLIRLVYRTHFNLLSRFLLAVVMGSLHSHVHIAR